MRSFCFLIAAWEISADFNFALRIYVILYGSKLRLDTTGIQSIEAKHDEKSVLLYLVIERASIIFHSFAEYAMHTLNNC